MDSVDPQLTASQVLRAFHHSELYLFLGAAFITVGIVSAAFSLLRRRLEPLLLWLALFAILYGTRMWIQAPILRLILPASTFFRDLNVAFNYVVAIPAFFFFASAGFVQRKGKILMYSLTAVFSVLAVATFVFGPRREFDWVENGVISVVMLSVVVRSLKRQGMSPDFVIMRWGLLVFAAFVLTANVSGAFNHFFNGEPYGFAVFLGCLGYVAARQTVRRETELGEIQKELEVARRMQLSILPKEFPVSTNFKVAARYVPMTSVAGDFYEFLVADDRQAGLLIADVSGHGVPAALIASMVKLAATSQRGVAGDPAELLKRMNAALWGNTQNQFVTAAYVFLDSERRELRYSAAGHPPLLLLRRGGVIELIENGLMLAVFAISPYSNRLFPLEAGDRLLLYTDGILEAANSKGEEFGQERLRAVLQESAALSPSEAADLIVSSVQKWGISQEDDLTVLVCDFAGVREETASRETLRTALA
jgi:sigma-B regulation protein RsbU (phosphoserine phosphatase)